MENVPKLMVHKHFSEFMQGLTDHGYVLTKYLVNCPDYGIPQARKRPVIFASNLGPVEIAPPSLNPANYLTVRDTIGHLPPIHSGGVHSSDDLHRSSSLADLNLKRIRASRPGGTWRDWEEELVASCHKRASGKTYPGIYSRMEWDKPSPTITTQCFGFGNGRFGHPEQDRAISLREAALLQTFPADYEFTSPGAPIKFSTIGRLIGNAVPPKLGQVVSRSIQKHLRDHLPSCGL